MTTSTNTSGSVSSPVVPALDKMFQILDFLTESAQPLSSADIAKHLSLPRSSTHNILHSLANKGVLFKDRDNRFHLGSYLLYWAGKYEQNQHVIDVFAELVHQHPIITQHTVTLSTLDKDEVVFLSCYDSPAPLGFTFRAGVRVPAAFSATGKAMLSTLPDEELEAMYGDAMPTPLTPCGVTSLEQLKKEMAVVKTSRVSLDDGQLRVGMYCMGTYVRDASGKAIAGMAVSFLQHEYEHNRAEVSTALVELAHQMEQRLSHPEAQEARA